MDFLQLCAERYSARSFTEAPIPDEVLNRILEAGRLAPTAMNLQPQRSELLNLQGKILLFLKIEVSQRNSIPVSSMKC